MLISQNKHLPINSLSFDELNHIDLTGRTEGLSRISNTTYLDFVQDTRSLRLITDAVLTKAPQLMYAFARRLP